jgi:hypothetical protein
MTRWRMRHQAQILRPVWSRVCIDPCTATSREVGPYREKNGSRHARATEHLGRWSAESTGWIDNWATTPNKGVVDDPGPGAAQTRRWARPFNGMHGCGFLLLVCDGWTSNRNYTHDHLSPSYCNSWMRPRYWRARDMKKKRHNTQVQNDLRLG